MLNEMFHRSLSLSLGTLLVTLLGFIPLCRGATHVETSVIADVSAIEAGQPFEVGIKLKMTPGWHTYWSNPGDAGLATRVKWSLPDGFSAGELQFPVPTQFDEPGGITVYGYENEVMLVSKITPPVDLKSAQSVTLAAKVSWLCCASVCIPGSADLNITLPVAAHATPANADIFTQWQAHVPTPSMASPTTLRLTDDHPHADIFAVESLDKNTQIIPSAVDGLVVAIGSWKLVNRSGVTGTLIPIDARALKGETINADELTVLITHRDAAGAVPIGEEVKVPISK